jgi:hypothetical protein
MVTVFYLPIFIWSCYILFSGLFLFSGLLLLPVTISCLLRPVTSLALSLAPEAWPWAISDLFSGLLLAWALSPGPIFGLGLLPGTCLH